MTTGGYTGRLHRQFWATTDNDVVLVDGFSCSCEPVTAKWKIETWWCPTVGYSASCGSSLFDTEVEALTRIESELAAKLSRIQDDLLAVRNKLQKAKK